MVKASEEGKPARSRSTPSRPRSASPAKGGSNGAFTASIHPETASLAGEDPETLKDYYRQMLLVRLFEQKAAEMYQRAKIGGYCHLNLGEEATVVGLMAALEARDYLFATYRDHGYAICRGIDPGKVMAELFGKQTGVSKGWGGSMHLFDESVHLMGGYGIVGGQIPPATGAALALSYQYEPGPGSPVVMCLMGDGATNIGAFHEGLNLAGLWHLPIVYVITDNGLGMGTPVAAAAAEPDLYKRGCSYRIPGVRVNGDDVIAVRDAAREAIVQARNHQPVLLEAVSYRLRGHSVVDPARYRTKEEVEKARRADPLPAMKAELIELGILDNEGFESLEHEVSRVVDEAVAFADESPDPEIGELFKYVYATPVPNVATQLPGDPLFPEEDLVAGAR
jgi:pyruvate dehydrogenase E1 component alpha subunit